MELSNKRYDDSTPINALKYTCMQSSIVYVLHTYMLHKMTVARSSSNTHTIHSTECTFNAAIEPTLKYSQAYTYPSRVEYVSGGISEISQKAVDVFAYRLEH